ncbi:hypothetical protein AQUCO_00500283v1 [Aquilegia coerulea]|uniref:B box-type domain-containing protein n=1 Tax=Aquilegia coerulea TaxID=218851 RepID=A0A2G5ERE5_AQUCA|nr:hypothetical protein AQUCO_00500283v1 [Aquilegia coerulea]
MKECELCNKPARMYCESDQASLCWECDFKVHSANFLVAKHSRNLLCHVCQSITPWKASGSKLGPTITACERCANRCGFQENINEEEQEDDEDDQDSHGGNEEEEEEEDEEEEEEEVNEDEDGDNQVVPWSCNLKKNNNPSPPPVVSSSSSEDSDSSNRFLKRTRDNVDREN